MRNPFSVVANNMGYEKRQNKIANLSDFTNYSWGIKEEFANEELETLDSKHAHVHSSVNKIAQALASTPIALYQDGDRVDSHPALDLIHDPAEHMTSTQFKSSITKHLLLAGDCFIEIVPEKIVYGDGRTSIKPSQLIPIIPPSKIEIIPGKDRFVDYYEYQSSSGDNIELDREEVAHLRFVSTSDKLYGLSPLQSMKKELAADEKAVSYNQKFFESSAAPGGILTSDQQMNPEAKNDMERRWNKAHRGVDNAHKVAVLGRGVEWQSIGLSQQDMQFIESREMTKEDIRSLYGVPGTLLGEEDSTFASAKEASRHFYLNVIIPMANRIAESLTKYILDVYWPNSNLKYDFNFLGSESLVPLVQDKAELQKTMIAAGIPPNMATKMIWGKEFYDEEIGQTAFIEANLVPMGSVPTSVKETGPQLSVDTMMKKSPKEAEDLMERWRKNVGEMAQNAQDAQTKKMFKNIKNKLGDLDG